jgi:hypothetical protein
MDRRSFLAALGGLVTGAVVGYQRRRAYSFLWAPPEPELVFANTFRNPDAPPIETFTLEDVRRAVEVLERNRIEPIKDGYVFMHPGGIELAPSNPWSCRYGWLR